MTRWIRRYRVVVALAVLMLTFGVIWVSRVQWEVQRAGGPIAEVQRTGVEDGSRIGINAYITRSPAGCIQIGGVTAVWPKGSVLVVRSDGVPGVRYKSRTYYAGDRTVMGWPTDTTRASAWLDGGLRVPKECGKKLMIVNFSKKVLG